MTEESTPASLAQAPVRLDGRTALITGGGRGIGRAIALTYAHAGANVVVVSRSADQVEAVRREIESLGAQGLAVAADVSGSAGVETMAAQALDAFGTVDILINNAGNLIYKPLVPLPGSTMKGQWTSPGPISDEEWHSTIDTHVSASVFALRALVPGMLEHRWGRVINITSAARSRTVPFCMPYEAA
jgi:NAD(P)-dependent dehydrogenase (short-subunit alcohol dehydrogenase family)